MKRQILFAALVALLACSVHGGTRPGGKRRGGSGMGGGPLYPTPPPACTAPFFERLGDLPGDAHYSEPFDLDHLGQLAVGESWADDPAVANDGQSSWAGTGPCPHALQAIVYRPACSGSLPPLSTGLTGLGTCAAERAESVASGVSPDGQVIVGSCNTGVGDCVGANPARSEAAVFDRGGAKTPLGKLPGHTSSAARDVSDRARPRLGAWSRSGGGGSGGPQVRGGDRVIVGYSSTANNHPHRVAGAQAVFWVHEGPSALPLPPLLPNGQPVTSSVATSISDDARVIAGNLHYDGPLVDGVALPAFACVWELGPGRRYGDAQVLGVLSATAEFASANDVSGNGQVVVGSAGDYLGTSSVACVWRRTSAGWAEPDGLGILPGMQYSLALSVDFSGTKAVGTSGFFDDVDYDYRPVRWSLGPYTMEDLLPALAAQYPAQGIVVDGTWKLDATAISGDGRVVAGRMNFPAPTAKDPFATLDEGWIALVP